MAEAVTGAVLYLSEGEVLLTAAEVSSILWTAAEVAFVAASMDNSRRQQQKARERQRDEYNASLRDRYVMSRGATEPRQLVLGRQRVSGPIFFMQSYGPHREHLVFCVALAAHEIDAVEAVYFDNEQVVLDGSGAVIGINRREYFSISAATASFTLNSLPRAGTVSAIAKYGTTSVTLGVGVTGQTVDVSGATAGQTGLVTISYQPAACPYFIDASIDTLVGLTLDGSGNGSVTLGGVVRPDWPIVVLLRGDVIGADIPDTDLTSLASVAGNVLTVSGGPPGGVLIVAYARSETLSQVSRARVRIHRGEPGQVADAGMVAALPGVWTSAHVASGVAYLVVELDYDPNAFPSGIPNVSAQVRGAKVFDPRTGTTAWSENPALLMRHAALSPLCGRLTAAVMNDDSIIVAANACDVSTTYTVNGQAYTRARYTAGTVVRSGTRGQDTLNDLAQAMGGRWAFIEGRLKVLAGAYVTPLQTLDDTWLTKAAPVQVQPRANRADVFNVLTGKFADESADYQVLDIPRVTSSAYVAEDGAELPLDVQYNAVTFTGQAQQLQAQAMRDARQSLKVSLTCNARADATEWGDTLLVTLPRFGWVNKPMSVLDVSYTLDGGTALALKETDPGIYDIGTAFADVDPAPNTLLPSPFNSTPVLGLTADSTNAVQVRANDGTVIQRIRVTWSALSDPAVLSNSGGIEVRYGPGSLPEAQWQSVFAAGSATSADLLNAQPQQVYMIKARTFNALVNGPWCAPIVHTMGLRQIAIGTAQLAANAATEFNSVAPANGSRTSVFWAGPPISDPQNIGTLSYTNSTGIAVQVEVFANCLWTSTGSSTGWSSTVKFMGTNGATDINSTGSPLTTSSVYQPYAYSRSFTVANGDTLVMNLVTVFGNFGSGLSGHTLNWVDAHLKYNVIKR